MPDTFHQAGREGGTGRTTSRLSVLQKACLDTAIAAVQSHAGHQRGADGSSGRAARAQDLGGGQQDQIPAEPARGGADGSGARQRPRGRASEAILALKRARHPVLVLDDFGPATRASAISPICRFDKLKIDRSFIKGFHDSRHANNTVRAIIGLGEEPRHSDDCGRHRIRARRRGAQGLGLYDGAGLSLFEAGLRLQTCRT